jgi:hypothetical protein
MARPYRATKIPGGPCQAASAPRIACASSFAAGLGCPAGWPGGWRGLPSYGRAAPVPPLRGSLGPDATSLAGACLEAVARE